MLRAKPVDKITPEDLEKHAVWTFDLANETLPGRDETWMVPVAKLPVNSLDDCGCLANATLACGRKVTAMLWSVDLASAERNELFIAIAFWLDRKWWHLSERMFPTTDGKLESHGEADLAAKLGLSMKEVFPISYDISQWANGPAKIVRGVIAADRKKLSREERRAVLLRQMKERPMR